MSQHSESAYDFDQMALAFGKMRAAFRAFQEGRTEAQLDAYLLESARFFARYPNPFANSDPSFIPGAEVFDEPSSTAPKLARLRDNEKALIKKLENLVKAQAGAEEYEKWEALLKQTRKKIMELTLSNDTHA